MIPINTRRDNSELATRLTSILISRFLLNLQAAEQKSTGVVSSTGSQVESAIFQRIIGSLGSDIEFGGDDNADDLQYDGAWAEDDGVSDIENSLNSRIEHTDEGAVQATGRDE